MANVLMVKNLQDYRRSEGAGGGTGSSGMTLDPTMTPMMDGDRSILDLNVDQAALKEVFRRRQPGGQCGRILLAARGRGRRRAGFAALQRGTYGLLCFAVRRRLSLRAISVAQREREADISFWTSGGIRRK